MIDMKSPEAIQTILAFVVPGLVLIFFRSEGPPADAGGITWRNVIPGTAL